MRPHDMAGNIRHALHCTLAVLACLPAAACAQDILDQPPPGAPTSTCDVPPSRDPASLRVIAGTRPLTFVFACGHNRPAGQCVVMRFTPGGRDMPSTTRFTTAGQQQNGWTCVDRNGLQGWLPSDRLAALPAAPATPLASWEGWWRNGPATPVAKNDHLLITPAKNSSESLHVTGRAYWYGMNGNVHFGQIDADVKPYGDTLHIVDGDTDGACVLDLVYQPATRTLVGADNQGCGGMNVRFSGTWRRFTPRPARK